MRLIPGNKLAFSFPADLPVFDRFDEGALEKSQRFVHGFGRSF